MNSSIDPSEEMISAVHNALNTGEYRDLGSPERNLELRRLVEEVQSHQSTTAPIESSVVSHLAANPLDDRAVEPAHESREEDERYELFEEIGKGGMGIVRRAKDRTLGCEVAVKILRKEHANKPTYSKRFIEEAKLTSQLQHAGIPPVHALGVLENGLPFLAMKRIKGRSLEELIKEKDKVPIENLLGIFEQIAQTLGYAHANRVIHRDLKPANIMLGTFGEVQLMDWGMAKALDDPKRDDNSFDVKSVRVIGVDGDSELKTVAGSLLGTPAFMSPEQARGEFINVGPAWDVFGFGAVLCAALTGHPPFVGNEFEPTLALAKSARLTDAFTRLDDCGADPELVALCKRCLSPDINNRPADGSMIASAIAKMRTESEERAKQAEIEVVRAREQAKRRRGRIISAGVIATVILLAGGYGVWMWINGIIIKNARLETEAVMLTLADKNQFEDKFPILRDNADITAPIFERILQDRIADDGKDVDKEQFARRQARAGVALLRMNRSSNVWPLMRFSANPLVRSYLVHFLAEYSVDPKLIVSKFLSSTDDPRFQQALLMSLGEFDDRAYPSRERHIFIDLLINDYTVHNDPGLHAATEWLLTKWGAKYNAQLKRKVESPKSQVQGKELSWYVDNNDHRMIVIHGDTVFPMGSPPIEAGNHKDEGLQHVRTIKRSFAVSSCLVTFKQYVKHNPSHEKDTQYSTLKDECPVVNVNWFQAAAYCNWLSEQEGIPRDQWCYHVVEQGKIVQLSKIYLTLSGYRLPTEAEYEYVARGGTKSSRCYGEAEDLLRNYAWYDRYSNAQTQAVGLLKPNDFGFFDVHGNVFTWCQNTYYLRVYPVPNVNGEVNDFEDFPEINVDTRMVLRGTSVKSQATLVRSAYRYSNNAINRDGLTGFRVARTIIP